jgi:hypothetical protein
MARPPVEIVIFLNTSPTPVVLAFDPVAPSLRRILRYRVLRCAALASLIGLVSLGLRLPSPQVFSILPSLANA